MSIITISRQPGAGGGELGRRLGEILGYECLDRELLHQEAQLSGIPEPELYRLEESPPSFWERRKMMDASARYFQALEEIMRSLAERDRLILVGRGANLFLADHPRAYHVNLVASLETRVRRVMAERWVNEGPARQIIQEHDQQRRAFVQHYFSADVGDSLLYHVVYNTDLIETPVAASLVAASVRRREAADASMDAAPEQRDTTAVDGRENEG